MLRWLPKTLQNLYRGYFTEPAYARSTRIRWIVEEQPTKPGGRERLIRLNIVQDARCQHRPAPKKLFHNPVARRDTTSWCDAPNAWTGRRRPRCEKCERAHKKYRLACEGDWKAEC